MNVNLSGVTNNKIMQRLAEPELMNDPEQALAYAAADFSQAHDAFVAHFKERFPKFSKGRAIDLGCGAADITIRFALAFPDVEIDGIEGAQAMLALGRLAVEQKKLGNRISLLPMRLPSDGVQPNHYDVVLSNSLLHHLDDPLTLWQTIRKSAKIGAPILVMDLVRPDNIGAAEDLARHYAADAPAVLYRDFYNSLLAAYDPEEIEFQLKQSGFGHLSIDLVSDRHVLICGVA